MKNFIQNQLHNFDNNQFTSKVLKFKHSSNSKLKENTLWLYLSHTLNYVVPVAIIPFLARVLGPDSWGSLIYFQSYSFYCALIVEFGYSLSATREISKSRQEKSRVSELTSEVFQGQFFLVVFVLLNSCLIYTFSDFLQKDPLLFTLAIFSGIFLGLKPFWFFQGLERLRLFSFIDLALKFTAMAGVFIFVTETKDNWMVLAFSGLSNLTITTFGIRMIIRSVDIKLQSNKLVLRSLLSSFNMFLIKAGASIFSIGNILIMGLYLPSSAIAVFGGAEKIVSAIRSFLNPAMQAVYPRIALLNADKAKNGEVLFKRIAIISGLLGLAMTIFTFFASGLLVKILLGQDYTDSVEILKYLSPLPLIISFILVIGYQGLIPSGLERYFLRVLLIGVLINSLTFFYLVSSESPLKMFAVNLVVVHSVMLLGHFINWRKKLKK